MLPCLADTLFLTNPDLPELNRMSLRTTLVVLTAAAAAFTAGCNFNSYVYRPDVHQGTSSRAK